jgi:hypothetical protein
MTPEQRKYAAAAAWLQMRDRETGIVVWITPHWGARIPYEWTARDDQQFSVAYQDWLRKTRLR